MPKPFILFEDHDSVAVKQFVIENITNLKALGYEKILVEMGAELSPSQFKMQIKDLLAKPSASRFHASFQKWLDLLATLEDNEICYEFIDLPVSTKDRLLLGTIIPQIVALGLDIADGRITALVKHLINASLGVIRDQHVADKIIRQAHAYEGGVIHIGGMAHTELVSLLEKDKPDYYRYAIFTHSAMDGALTPPSPAAHNFADMDMRTKFYGAIVHHFDLATELTFAMIETISRLTDSRACSSLVGEYLGRVTNVPYECRVDQHLVVNAHTQIPDEAQLTRTIRSLRDNFPRLRFFVDRSADKPSLVIPGVNLAETLSNIQIP